MAAITIWSSTARPWKVTEIQKESNLPTIIFQGRAVKLRGCNKALFLGQGVQVGWLAINERNKRQMCHNRDA